MLRDQDASSTGVEEPRSNRALFIIFGALVVVVIGLALVLLDTLDTRRPPAGSQQAETTQSPPAPSPSQTSPAPQQVQPAPQPESVPQTTD
jgi:hypothetical protein